MKKPLTIFAACLAGAAQAQHMERVYNRDTHDQFKLKDVAATSVVKGPIVKQRTVYTFENPFTKLTEASAWFNLDHAAILSGFAYWYKNEYVPGVLMDKNKAWFIYTAITSRNEDPGIMVQTSPSSYHAQIYPLAIGHDLRLELDTVGFLQPSKEGLFVSKPSFNEEKYPLTVKSALPETIRSDVKTETYVDNPGDLLVYAQKHKDGYTYVAGMLRTDRPEAKLKVSGMRKVYWTRPTQFESDGTVKLFIGRRKGSGPIRIAATDKDYRRVSAKYIKANEKGADTAKLWAHQKLVQDQWRRPKDVLNFSLKYQIPSTQTALLAVPQEQMKLFKQKAAEYRRKQAQEARKNRAWQNQRRQNWANSSGGDPEIRVHIPNAKRVYAVLPDGRTFDLAKASNGYWGGNYEIPATASEGDYQVKVYSVDANDVISDQTISYQVDRTAPTGTLKVEEGFLVLRAEAGLPKVVAVFGDGTEETMVEIEPGIYKIPKDHRRLVKVMLIDKAHNIGEVTLTN